MNMGSYELYMKLFWCKNNESDQIVLETYKIETEMNNWSTKYIKSLLRHF